MNAVSLLTLTLWHAQAANVTITPVLTAGAKAVGCVTPGPCVYKAFRIPGFVNAGGTLLAFAEGRATGCGDYSGYHDMVMTRSTASVHTNAHACLPVCLPTHTEREREREREADRQTHRQTTHARTRLSVPLVT